jgi:hypothetical protein
MPLVRAEEPFVFKTQMSLVEMTGLRASDLSEFCFHLKNVPESCIYYHTHHFLQQHQFLTPEPPNDFAYWVANILQEDTVGERLAAIDTVQFDTLEDLRGALVSAIDEHLTAHKTMRQAPEGEEFHFMKSMLFALPTGRWAYDLKEFLDGLKEVSVGCLYNHIFAGRLRPPLGVNDFSDWFERSLAEGKLAQKIEGLDPYTFTMEGLRRKMIDLIEKRLEHEAHD